MSAAALWYSQTWSSNLATQVEAVLISFVSQISTVIKPHGCSFEKYCDYKILFRSSIAKKPDSNGFLLEYIPARNTLRAWSGGLGYIFPKDVKAFIDTKFPHAEYHLDRGPGIEGFHNWTGISEEDLRNACNK